MTLDELLARFQTSTEDLADETMRDVLAVYRRLSADEVTLADAVLLIAGILNRGIASAVTLAEVYLIAQVEASAGVAVLAAGVRPADHSERLMKAVDTVLQDRVRSTEDDAADVADKRLQRLARAEVFEAAQDGAVEALQAQRLVEGWTRQMDADPCQLCRWWWREGRVWPKNHPFQRHKGCNCQPRVVLAEHIESTMFTRQLERNRAS